MTRARGSTPTGFTLVELLVAMTVTAIVGAALIQLILAQNRSSGNNEAWRVARAVSRGSLNRMLADFRIAEAEGALDPSATMNSKDITLRVPFAIGVACDTTLPLIVSLLPLDVSQFNASLMAYGGFAWRDAGTGIYRYRTNSVTASYSASTACSTAGIAPIPASGVTPGGAIVTLNADNMGNVSAPYTGLTPSVGMNVLLFQRVRYWFGASAALPGQTALWREVTGVTPEELAAPFDATARFRFYVLGNNLAQDAVPSPRSLARGIEIHLDGLSETTPQGSTGPKRIALTTSIFFKNHHD